MKSMMYFLPALSTYSASICPALTLQPSAHPPPPRRCPIVDLKEVGMEGEFVEALELKKLPEKMLLKRLGEMEA